MQKRNGISLIVLVITIIVMIVLAGAIILSLNNAGIIWNANQAVADSDLANIKHMASLAWAEGYSNNLREREDLEDYVFDYFNTNKIDIEGYGIEVTEKGVDVVKGWANSGNKIISGTKEIVVGTVVNYNPTAGVEDTSKLSYTALQTVTGASANQEYNASDYSGTWKIIGAENGNILLVSTDNIGLYKVSYGKLYISGETEINNISAIYGHGYGAQGTRSINEDDVNRLTGFDEKNIDNRQVTVVAKEGKYEYIIGDEKIIGGKFVYPENNSWVLLKDGESKTINLHSYIYLGIDEFNEPDILNLNMNPNSEEFKLVFRDSNGECLRYFLDNQYIYMKEKNGVNNIYFGLVVVGDNGLGGGPASYGDSKEEVSNFGVRPIVELKNNIVLEKQADGSYNIK